MEVTLAGELALSDPITCYDNGKRCVAELVDSANSTVGPGHPRTIFIYVDRSSLESGPRIRLTGGGFVETGGLVRVTGRVCRTDAEPPETCVVVELIESAGGPIAGASPATPTPMPTATPEPTPTPDEELAAACDGTSVPWAAPYAGKAHPLVIVDQRRVSASYPINKKWLNSTWTSPIQLVVCPGDVDSVKVDSCGTYTRRSDQVAGEVIRYKQTQKIRVAVAKTGKILQTKVLVGAVEPCSTSYSGLEAWSLTGEPPWRVQGPGVTEAQIDTYATAVSKQPAK